MAIIGGAWPHFKPLVDLYRRSGSQAGHGPPDLRVAITSPLYIQKGSQQARDEFYPYYTHFMNWWITRMRGGHEMRYSRADFDGLTSLQGALFVGSPQEIIDKILYQRQVFGHQRFLAQLDGLPYRMVAPAIELLATEVVPVIRRETAHAPSG